MKKLQVFMIFVLLSFSMPGHVSAAMQGESIYDLLVDRYFNQTNQNDQEVNTQDPQAFAGGDFLGVMDRLDHIQEMGFSYLSLGPVFMTETYNGSEILDYSQVEPRFGTSEEFVQLIETLHNRDMKVMIDLPLAQATELEFDQMKKFLDDYAIDGVKLTGLEEEASAEIEDFVESINSPELDVISVDETTLELDVNYSTDVREAFQQGFKNIDQSTEELSSLDPNQLVMLDTLYSERFTHFTAQENMFPPSRIKVALGALMTLPGVPFMTYGTEIAMNGDNPETSHQIMNFRVDEDIMLFLEDVQTVRNQSEALKTGNFELLENDNGYMVFKRWTEDETFIVVVNNSSETKTFVASEEIIGVDKELRGLFEQDVVRQDNDGNYKLAMDRELVELYHVKEDNGLNVAYIAAMIIAYLLFMLFLYLVWRKGKQKQKMENE